MQDLNGFYKHSFIMNILFVTYDDPRDASFGSTQRSNFIWKSLMKLGVVYTVCLFNDKRIYLDKYENHPIYHYIPEMTRKQRMLEFPCKIMEYFCRIPLSPIHPSLNGVVKRVWPDVKFDVIVGRYIQGVAKYQLWRMGRTIVDIDDHPAEAFRTIRRPMLNPLFRPIGDLLNKISIKYVFNRIEGGYISNAQQLSQCPNSVRWLPNIPQLPSNEYQPDCDDRPYLLTIGLMSYIPNFEGVDIFLTEVWPEVHKQFPQLTYKIGGKDAPQDCVDRWNATEGVEYVGFIDDLEDAYRHCLATVAPIYKGAGTCIKVLESLAYGRACLSSPFGARGLELKGREGVYVFQSPKELIDSIMLLQDKKLRKEIEQTAPEIIQSQYSYERFEATLLSVIKGDK